MTSSIYILGGYQTDFARNYAREGLDIFDLLREGVEGALEDARVAPADVDVAHVGNFNGELFSHQGHLGGLVASLHPDLRGVPASRHEAACASGSAAVLSATAELEAGRYELACVAGIELMRNVDGKTAADYLGTAAWTGHESVDATYLWPAMFDRIRAEYVERYGVASDVLWEIAAINFDHAKRNPRAQTRKWTFEAASFSADDEKNPRIEGEIRRQDCGQVTDGAAVVILASPERAASWARERNVPLESIPRIVGWGHRTSPMHLEEKLRATRGQPYVFPELRQTFEDAWKRAGLEGPHALDCLEVHDCFSITEYAILDHLRFVPEGETARPIQDRTIAQGGALPINPSGGLIGAGHPVGATGVRMLHDAARQVSGRAGDCQVAGARVAQTMNIGGPCSALASFVVRA